VLTTLGVLLAADHLGHLSFGRTWPALLIVFGACKLVEHLGGTPGVSRDQRERSR
jgi:hypothetical protein